MVQLKNLKKNYNYNNNSVAIHCKKENSALTSIKFASIKKGTVYDSYGEEKEFDFTSL